MQTACSTDFRTSVTLGWTFSPGEPQHYARHQWAGLAVMLGVNVVGTPCAYIVLLLLKQEFCRAARHHHQARHRLVHLRCLDVCLCLEPPAEAHASLGASLLCLFS